MPERVAPGEAFALSAASVEVTTPTGSGATVYVPSDNWLTLEQLLLTTTNTGGTTIELSAGTFNLKGHQMVLSSGGQVNTMPLFCDPVAGDELITSIPVVEPALLPAT